MNFIQSFKKFLILFISMVIILYVSFGFRFYFKQREFIYYPDDQDFMGCEGFKEYQKIIEGNLRFYYLNRGSDKVLIYYHGNAGSTCNRSVFKDYFEEKDFDLIFVEYPGYSDDNQHPTQDKILDNVSKLDEFIERKRYKETIVYGRSIGTGVASYYASLGSVDKLILVSPFYSMENLVQKKIRFYPTSLFLKDKYTNNLWLEDFRGELLILHGEKDQVIPVSQSRKLFNEITLDDEFKEYVLIKEKGHNDIWSSNKFLSVLSEFLND